MAPLGGLRPSPGALAGRLRTEAVIAAVVLSRVPLVALAACGEQERPRAAHPADTSLVVVDDDARPLGVVTDRDIVVRLVATGQDPSQVRAGDCMTSPVVTLNVDSDLRECADVMVRERIRRVPIVDDDGRLCGIVALADLERRNDVRSLKAEVSRQVSQPH